MCVKKYAIRISISTIQFWGYNCITYAYALPFKYKLYLRRNTYPFRLLP